ncbi:MAG: hypothetical protein CVT89_05900 [Candidatus Altiarchaeales archaeon HGW-Altiarchaeales-2]|nr:MAG: hypothetical protein CVT89_05900 [Candidatus Altiarchaeales archaeon HGW-Altiarchaeales-2]
MECGIVKVRSDGRIVIPKNISTGIGIQKGNKLFVCATEREITLRIIKCAGKSESFLERDFSPLWNKANKRGITKKDVEKEIENYRKEKGK